MKIRTLAGLAAATAVLASIALVAPSASAATASETCTTRTRQPAVTASDPAKDPYFTDCMPVFAEAPVRFLLDSPHTFAKVDLTQSSQIAGIYSTLPASTFSRYYGSDAQALEIRSGTGHGVYEGTARLQVASVGKISTSSLPSGCRASTTHYDAAYRVTYLPLDATIQMAKGTAQTWSGSPGSFEVTKTVPSLYLGLNFKEGTTSTNSSDHFQTAAAQCAASNGDVVFASTATSSPSNWQLVVSSALYSSPSYWPLGAGVIDLGHPLYKPDVFVQTAGSAGDDAKVIVTVKWRDEYQAGTVSVTVDGTRIKTDGALVDGKLRVTLPHSTVAGSHSFAVAFPGGPGALPISVTKTVTVAR